VSDKRIVLQGDRVTLRPPRAGDGAARLALGSSPEIHRLFGGSAAEFRQITADAAQAWEAAQIAEPFAWIIEVDGRLAGAIRLHSLNPVYARAMLAIGILDPACLGQGYGTQAMRLLAAHAFGAMGLHRLSVRVLDFNTRAIAAYLKVGFVEEGRERESALIDGVWHDDLMLGLLARDFRA
jgi:RimJ/RimL family protein N-acetyltransferase